MWEQSNLMNDSTVAGGFMSPATPKFPTTRERRAEEVVPVTVAMVHDILPQAESIQIGNHAASRVRLIGLIRSRKRQELSISYHLDDFTGPPIAVRQWTSQESGGEFDDASDILEETYVKVIGNLRSYDDETYINAFHICPLKDMSELTAHLLQVEFAKHYYTQDLLEKRQEMTAGGSGNMAGRSGLSVSAGSYGGRAEDGHSTSGLGMGSSGCGDIGDKVHLVIKQCRAPDGMTVEDLLPRFPGMKAAEMSKLLDRLSSEGYVYPSIDEFHFKSTEAI